jgi:hypothetical protein
MPEDLPEVFMKLCRNLVQDLDVSSSRELAQIALVGIEPHELGAVKATLKDLLSGRYTDDELKDLWWSTPSDIVFYEGKDVVTFLKLLQSEIDPETQAH